MVHSLGRPAQVLGGPCPTQTVSAGLSDRLLYLCEIRTYSVRDRETEQWDTVIQWGFSYRVAPSLWVMMEIMNQQGSFWGPVIMLLKDSTRLRRDDRVDNRSLPAYR